jgi:hypothetical protein
LFYCLMFLYYTSSCEGVSTKHTIAILAALHTSILHSSCPSLSLFLSLTTAVSSNLTTHSSDNCQDSWDCTLFLWQTSYCKILNCKRWDDLGP